MFSMDIGIDLGTATTLVYVRGKGVVVHEPSVVAIDQERRQVLAVGTEAHRMIGRTPGHIVALRPLKEGVIADYHVTEQMLQAFIAKVCGRRRVFKPRVMVCVPSGVTAVERRAVVEACLEAGARDVYLISEPMAAAIGAGLSVDEPSGTMVVDIGGGTTDIAVISLGAEVVSTSLRIAGDDFDEALVRYVRRTHNLLIGERTAEEVKIQIGSALDDGPHREVEVRGRDTVAGLPRTVSLTAREVAQALHEPVTAILDAVRNVLEQTPPELAADVADKGIVLTGGGALLHGLPSLVTRVTGIPAYLADDPVTCVARGTGKVLSNLDHLRPSLTSRL